MHRDAFTTCTATSLGTISFVQNAADSLSPRESLAVSTSFPITDIVHYIGCSPFVVVFEFSVVNFMHYIVDLKYQKITENEYI